MKPIERLAYSPIVERTPLKLPGRARVAVWIIVNVEVWDIGRAMPRQVLPPSPPRAPSSRRGQAGRTMGELR